MNWQTYLPTPAQIEADNALLDAAQDRLTNFVKIQFDGMTGDVQNDGVMKSEYILTSKSIEQTRGVSETVWFLDVKEGNSLTDICNGTRDYCLARLAELTA